MHNTIQYRSLLLNVSAQIQCLIITCCIQTTSSESMQLTLNLQASIHCNCVFSKSYHAMLPIVMACVVSHRVSSYSLSTEQKTKNTCRKDIYTLQLHSEFMKTYNVCICA